MENQFNLITPGFGFDNFDPTEIQTDEVILVTIACDISPSMEDKVDDLNSAFSEFIAEMQRSHVSSKLMVKIIEFNENVVDRTGFQPIVNIDASHVTFIPKGSSTALGDAAFKAVEATVKYREDLEKTGVNCKSLVFVITDGESNTGRDLTDVKRQLQDLMKEERNVFSFETIFFGIGNRQYYESSFNSSGFKHLAVVGNTGKEVRKLIGFISASVSKSSTNQPIQF